MTKEDLETMQEDHPIEAILDSVEAVAPAAPPSISTEAAISRGADGWHMSAELAAYITLFVIGALFRFVGLGAKPLGPDEALLAVAALEGGSIGASPLLHHLTWLAMLLFGSSEAVVRFLPALAGSLLVPAAWGLRGGLGRAAALGAAAVLALSPIWVLSSRVLEASSLSVLLILCLVWAMSARRPVLAAIAAALALAAGDAVWLALAALLLAMPLAIAIEDENPLSACLRYFRDHPRVMARVAIAFGLTLVLALTAGWRLDGLMALLGAPREWLAVLARDRSDPIYGGLLPLLVHAPELVLFGLFGLLLGPARAGWRVWLLLWLLLAAGVAMVSASPWALAGLLAPLALQSGVALARLATSLRARFRWSEEGVMSWILLVVLGYALLHAWRYAHAGPIVGQRDDWALMSGSLAMAVVLVLAFAALWGVGMALRVVGLVGGIVCLWLAASNAVGLARHDGPELWRPRRTMAGAAAVADLAGEALRAKGGGAVVVDPRLRDGLAWPLRNLESVEWGAPGADAAGRDAAWIGPLGDPAFDAAVVAGTGDTQEHLSREFAVSHAWRPAFSERQGFVRWYLQRAVRGDASFRPVYPEVPRTVRVVVPWAPSTSFASPDRGATQYVVEGWR